MILSDTYIKEFGENLVSPFKTESVQPASYDLCLGESITINPGEFMRATTVETIKMPTWLTGKIEGKSSIGRLGLDVENAGRVDPGFSGEITLELFNKNERTIHIPEGSPICQIVFEEVAGKVESPYDGYYQNQEGATKSYLDPVAFIEKTPEEFNFEIDKKFEPESIEVKFNDNTRITLTREQDQLWLINSTVKQTEITDTVERLKSFLTAFDGDQK